MHVKSVKRRFFRYLSLLVVPSLVGGFGMMGNAQAGDKSIHHLSSDVCKSCHKDIYKQWKGSMHANSTALKDPIHGAFYGMVVGDPTKEGVKHKASGKFPVCLQCHAPNAAKDKITKLDAKPAYSEGVNCVACHTLKNFKGVDGPDGKMRLGLKAYEVADKIQGPATIQIINSRSWLPLVTSSDLVVAMRNRGLILTWATLSHWMARRSLPFPWRAIQSN